MDKSYRQHFYHAWQKHLRGYALSEFEHRIVEVLLNYPEYTKALSPDSIDVDNGENPYLILGAHMEVKDQLRLDRPRGIKKLVDSSSKGGAFVESLMVELMVYTLKSAYINKTPPSYEQYLRELRIALGYKV